MSTVSDLKNCNHHADIKMFDDTFRILQMTRESIASFGGSAPVYVTLRSLTRPTTITTTLQVLVDIAAEQDASELKAEGWYPISGKHLTVARLSAYPVGGLASTGLSHNDRIAEEMRKGYAPHHRKNIDVDVYVALKKLWRTSGDHIRYVPRRVNVTLNINPGLLSPVKFAEASAAFYDYQMQHVGRIYRECASRPCPRVLLVDEVDAFPAPKVTTATRLRDEYRRRIAKKNSNPGPKRDNDVATAMYRAVKTLQHQTREERIEKALAIWQDFIGVPMSMTSAREIAEKMVRAVDL